MDHAAARAYASGMAPGQTLLVIDDEQQIRRVVRNALRNDVSRVLEAATGMEGVDLAAAERPHVIILDLGLPDTTGLEVCREIRRWSVAPILVLSARHTEQEKVALLDAGADDYVTKPFGPAELQARVRALLRRAVNVHAAGPAIIRAGDLVMNVGARTLARRGEPVRLTPTEWNLLHALASRAGLVLTHQQLFAAVWGAGSHGDAQQHLRVHIAHLRRKIEDDPVRPYYITTEPGVGYRFLALADASDA